MFVTVIAAGQFYGIIHKNNGGKRVEFVILFHLILCKRE